MLFRFEKQLEEEDPFLPSPQTNRFFSYKFRFLLPSPPPCEALPNPNPGWPLHQSPGDFVKNAFPGPHLLSRDPSDCYLYWEPVSSAVSPENSTHT